MEKTAWRWGIEVALHMFPHRASGNVYRYFPSVESALTRFHIVDVGLKLVSYATIRAETGDFRPITERESKYNTLKIPLELVPLGETAKYNLYEGRDRTRTSLGHKVSGLGNDRIGDGSKYIGRGFVQLTGKTNYSTFGHAIGMGSQLVENPELANDPKIAALVLAAYIARHRGQIQSALSHGDLRSARRAVNGGTNGLDVFEKAFTIGLNLTRKELRDLPNVSSIA